MGHLIKDASGKNADCPVYKFSVIFENKWAVVVIRDLIENEVCRFSDFRKRTPYMTDRALNQCLLRLLELKLIEKQSLGSLKHFSQYRLSKFGETLKPVFKAMINWGELSGEKWWEEIAA